MASKTIRKAIADTLEGLTDVNFEKFRNQLLDRRAEPRVKCRQIENKSFLDVTNVLVSTFTESGALKVTVEILRDINCNNHADELEQETSGQSSKPGSCDTARPSAGAAGVNTMENSEHFVDRYKVQLIRRVTSTSPILDELLQHNIIQQEGYNIIRALATPQDRMREIYCRALQGGTRSKDIFYKILEENEPYLIKDLKTNN